MHRKVLRPQRTLRICGYLITNEGSETAGFETSLRHLSSRWVVATCFIGVIVFSQPHCCNLASGYVFSFRVFQEMKGAGLKWQPSRFRDSESQSELFLKTQTGSSCHSRTFHTIFLTLQCFKLFLTLFFCFVCILALP